MDINGRNNMTAAQTAATTDKTNQRFAVYPGDGNLPFLTNDRNEAVALAHKTNGTWTRVPSDTVAADLVA
jgi:hypothetical protein